jgi:hypothetical protein
MKEIFFKGVAVAIPVLLVGGLVYMMFHGVYSLYSDWQLKKELEEIRRDSIGRRRRARESGGAQDHSAED